MKRLLALAALAALFLSAPLSRARAATPAPIEIDAILSLRGGGAFIGNLEAQTLGIVEKLVDSGGGIQGRPIRFVVADDQSNPQVAVQLANELIAKHVAVILGSSLQSTCKSVAPLVAKAGPVDYCFSPGMKGDPGGYVFSSGAGTDSIAATEARFFRERGYTRLAMLSLTDASGQDHEEQFVAALRRPENRGVELVAQEHFGASDVSVAAQMARIKAVHPQALVTAATGTAFGTLMRGFHDAGMDIPMSSSAGNMIPAQLAQYKDFAPKELYLAATHGVAVDPSVPKGPLAAAQSRYFDAFAAAGMQPDYLASLAWDPAWIVVDALRRLGPQASAEQLHAYVEGLRGWPGINGSYDFRNGNQRGIGTDALLVYRWNPATNTFAVASRPGGAVR